LEKRKVCTLPDKPYSYPNKRRSLQAAAPLVDAAEPTLPAFGTKSHFFEANEGSQDGTGVESRLRTLLDLVID